MEVLVVTDAHDEGARALAARFPFARIIEISQSLSVPAQRSLGIRAARGDIIVLTEDHCTPAADWAERILETEASDEAAVGGRVENSCQSSLLDWAVYFCEYGPYYRPAAGVAQQLSGNNVAYKRWALEKCRDLLERGAWETDIHRRLQGYGFRLRALPTMVVYYKNQFRFGRFLRQRFQYGRCFAGTRIRAAESQLERVGYIAGSPLLPLLLTARMARQAWHNKYYAWKFLSAFPLVLLFTISWSLGEWCGYLFGPGMSCDQT
jgi:glycosyltransferase involved in cell wall biosynthesis